MRRPPSVDPTEAQVADFPEHWINVNEAQRLVSRSRRALDAWHNEKKIRRKRRGGE